MIAWKYIDKNNAAIAAIRDYDNMRAIINNTPDEIKELYNHMTAPRTANLSGLPQARNPHAVQDKVADQIDKMDVLRERYSNAVEYMTWYEPAWGTLTDTEQSVLREFYGNGNQRSGANARLQQVLNYSERNIEYIRSKSLSKLTLLLFGK